MARFVQTGALPRVRNGTVVLQYIVLHCSKGTDKVLLRLCAIRYPYLYMPMHCQGVLFVKDS